jgi:hypothetical protein
LIRIGQSAKTIEKSLIAFSLKPSLKAIWHGVEVDEEDVPLNKC